VRNIIKPLLQTVYHSRKVNRVALKLYSSIFPPPYLRDNVEFHYDMWVGISSFYGENGRQIGENNTAPRRYKENMETLHKPSRFEGTRAGLLVNMTALRHVMNVWDESIQLTTALRDDYIRHRKLENTRFNLRQGYVFSKIGAALPSYLARRRESPILSGSLPPLETAFYTLGVGVFMTVRKLMEAGDLIVLCEDPMSAEQLYDLTENSGALVTPAGKGCAGSKKMIIEFLDIAMNGSFRNGDLTAKVRQSIDNIGDMDQFYDYLYAGSRLELLIKLNQYITASSIFSMHNCEDALTGKQRELLEKSLLNFSQSFAIAEAQQAKLGNTIEILLSLLEELNCTTIRQDLDRLGLLTICRGPETDLEIPVTTQVAKAVYTIQAATELMHKYCEEELSRINCALGRVNSRKITIGDMYSRANGSYVKPLIDKIDYNSE
jgi:hypothetical protein